MKTITLILAILSQLTGHPESIVNNLSQCPPNASACTQLNGSVIWMDPSWYNSLKFPRKDPAMFGAALVITLHETAHDTGIDEGSSDWFADSYAYSHVGSVLTQLGYRGKIYKTMRDSAKYYSIGKAEYRKG